MDNVCIENIRKDSIVEIKEKVKKNSKYLHPTNNERQKDIEKLGFDNGYEYICWLQQNGILKSPTKIEKEYKNGLYKSKGFDGVNSYNRELIWNKGIHSPTIEDEDLPQYFGIEIFEEIIGKIFVNFQRMPPGNPGFDYICGKGYKIQCMAGCLTSYGMNKFRFQIDYNNIADYFLLGGFDNRKDKNLLRLWLIHKDEMIRIGKGQNKEKLWKRDSLCITNKPKYLLEYKKYEVEDKLYKFRECSKIVEGI